MELAKYSADILKILIESTISIFISNTGSGKSSFIPFCAAFSDEKSEKTIFITCNTIFSALSLYERQKKIIEENLKKDPNKIVGYAAESVKHYDENTKIVYCTAEHILNRMLNIISTEGNFDFCDYIFVDEAHTQTIQISLILSLWNKMFKDFQKVPKLIIATANEYKFFEDINPVYNIFKTKGYEVSKIFLENTPSKRNLYDEIAQKLYEIHELSPSGNILVFVPGRSEMERAIKKFLELAKDSQNDFEIYRIIRGSNDQNNLDDNSKGSRKILFGTNIIETSITVKDLFCVIDSMKEKNIMTSYQSAKFLETQTIPKASSIQRAGRLGRTCPGIYIAMISEDDYNKLPEYRIPEIKRIDLYEMILKLFSSNLNPFEILADAPRTTIERNILGLIKFGYLKEKIEEKSYEVSRKGKICSRFPMKIKNSSFLYDWIETKKDYVFVGAIIASIVDSLDTSSFFVFNEKEDDQKKIDSIISKYRKVSDIATFLNIILTLIIYVDGDTKNKYKVSEFCNQNMINFGKVREIFTKTFLCIKEIRQNGYNTKLSIPEPNEFIENHIDEVEKLFYFSYFDRELNYIDQQYYYYPKMKIDEKISLDEIKKNGKVISVDFMFRFKDEDIKIKLNEYSKNQELLGISIVNGISRYNIRNLYETNIFKSDKNENTFINVKEQEFNNDDDDIIVE